MVQFSPQLNKQSFEVKRKMKLEPDNSFGGHFKGQLILKANCQAVNYSKKRTNEFIFSAKWHVSAHFLEEIEDSKKAFQNHLIFS